MKTLNLRGVLPSYTDLAQLADLIAATKYLLSQTSEKVEYNTLAGQLHKYTELWNEQSNEWAKRNFQTRQYSEKEYLENLARTKDYLNERIAWHKEENDKELSRMQINSSKRHLGMEKEKSIEERIAEGIAQGLEGALGNAMAAEKEKQAKEELLRKEQEDLLNEENDINEETRYAFERQKQRQERLNAISAELDNK